MPLNRFATSKQKSSTFSVQNSKVHQNGDCQDEVAINFYSSELIALSITSLVFALESYV